jgi:hypothetical protein
MRVKNHKDKRGEKCGIDRRERMRRSRRGGAHGLEFEEILSSLI